MQAPMIFACGNYAHLPIEPGVLEKVPVQIDEGGGKNKKGEKSCPTFQ